MWRRGRVSLALSEGSSTFLCTKPNTVSRLPAAPHTPAGLCLSCIPGVDGAIPCLPSPAEVPSWHSEPQKQWKEAGDRPQLAPGSGRSNFSQSVVQQSCPRAGLGEQSCGHERRETPCCPGPGYSASGWGRILIRTGVGPSVSRTDIFWFKPQAYLWSQAQNPT